jgi:hypothetical protein
MKSGRFLVVVLSIVLYIVVRGCQLLICAIFTPNRRIFRYKIHVCENLLFLVTEKRDSLYLGINLKT